MQTLKPFQREALDCLRHPGHVICVAPTGSGKSLIFQQAARDIAKRTLIIVPLVALARQQAERLRELELPVSLTAGGSRDRPSLRRGVWIATPETFLSPSGQRALRAWKPDLLVVDECHCIADWGEDFRPAFSRPPDWIQEHEIPRSLWLTATLPQDVRASLRERLQRAGPVFEVGRSELPSKLWLGAQKLKLSERLGFLSRFLETRPDPGIVFALTRATSERLARAVRSMGRKAELYHAGMSREERLATEAEISRADPGGVVVATSAFGMGMNFPHLGWALLWQAPPSLLFLMQAAGRAGRADRAATAWMLWDDDDFEAAEWLGAGSERRKTELRKSWGFLSSDGCRRELLHCHFNGGPPSLNPDCEGQCDRCLR